MNVMSSYVYTHRTPTISSTETVHSSLRIVTTIALRLNMLKIVRITTASDGTSTEQTIESRKLDPSDIPIMSSLLDHIPPTSRLTTDLLHSTFYTHTYLPSNMSSFTVPTYTPPWVQGLYLFSSMIIPFQLVDKEEVRMGKEYGSQIVAQYNKTHSGVLRECKHVGRQLLILPGIPLTPILVGAALLALRNMH